MRFLIEVTKQQSMRRIILRRIFLTAALALLTNLPLFAMNVELRPEKVIPGDVFLLRVQPDKSAAGNTPQAEFAGRKIGFYQDADNHFIALVPVDIDTSPGKYPVTIKAGDEEKISHVNVGPHKFPTKKITLPGEKVILSPEDLQRAGKEAELLKNILSQTTSPEWDGRFKAPMDTKVSETFGVKRIMNGKKTSVHGGLDYKGQMGAPVKAVNAGTVVLRDEFFFGGNTLVIDHGMGLFSVYMHLSEFKVSKDEKISKGHVIGLVGMTGRATGPHLHFGFNLQGVRVNPASLFKLKL
ncbi:MAG: M23 family metallopeptidase [Nitrospiraceae bacterium]|nr:MAG: M23 family metallopeptidase [Nitrospiraceae bacterium]